VKVTLTLGANILRADILKLDGKYKIKSGHNKAIVAHIKRLAGAKWDGEAWTIADNRHNRFQLAYMMGQNVYAQWEKEPEVLTNSYRPLMAHQQLLLGNALAKHCVMWAAEMGTGKTLAMIELMERVPIDWLYVGPISACTSVRYEFKKWGFKGKCAMLTYEDLVKATVTPQGLLLDESSRAKTPTAKRSVAAFQMAERMRAKYKDDHYIVCATGSPATKNPLDWWHQVEILCPGYLVEGDTARLRHRLAIYAPKKEDVSWPIILGWRDSEDRCSTCGKMKNEHHGKAKDGHLFTPCINEVAKLGRRLKDIVTVVFKKDCLDLPELRRVMLKAKPDRDLLLAAQKVFRSTGTAIEGLTKLRQLSDGFLYSDEEGPEITCPACNGTKETFTIGLKEGWIHDDGMYIDPDGGRHNSSSGAGTETKVTTCYHCEGTGIVRSRGTVKMTSPKAAMLAMLLERYEEAGRVVVYAGFQASVDMVEEECKKQDWSVFKADGRGWIGDEELLRAMDRSNPEYLALKQKYPKIAFIGHPKSAGMGLTLTSSPVVIYYSNDFNADDRVQSEARIHRAGMDTNTCPTIIDLVVLDTDTYVLKNLMTKRTLQGITLGQIEEEMKHLKLENVEVEDYNG
jgi:hypothetical protein